MTPVQQAYENRAKTIIKNLEKRRMEGYYCENREQARELVKNMIGTGNTIGWGGSVTVKECGILEAIEEGNTLYDRLSVETLEERRLMHGKIAIADYYLMGTNAITIDGELINIDGYGNRVACLCYGPKNVIIVAGMNKVVTGVEEGIKRVRNFASPPNTVRLSRNTPCAVTGVCGDCYGEDCICSQFVITRRSGELNRIKVVLVGEELGF